MSKVPRFAREYASFHKKRIEKSDILTIEKKKKEISVIEAALRNYERGLITIDETMDIIHKSY